MPAVVWKWKMLPAFPVQEKGAYYENCFTVISLQDIFVPANHCAKQVLNISASVECATGLLVLYLESFYNMHMFSTRKCHLHSSFGKCCLYFLFKEGMHIIIIILRTCSLQDILESLNFFTTQLLNIYSWHIVLLYSESLIWILFENIELF